MTKKTLTGYPSIDRPWLKYYSQEAIDTMLPECTMYELIFKNNQDNLNRIAIDYYGTRISYGQMFQEISYLAGTLENSGIKEGDAVTICMINSPETIFLLFAINKIGAVANMVCGFNTCEELKKCIIDVKSKIIFTLDSFQIKFEQIMEEIQVEKIIVIKSTQSMSQIDQNDVHILNEITELPLPGDSHFITWEYFLADKMESVRTCHDSNAPAVITYTGGTTGGSKGALLSCKSVIINAQQYVMGESSLIRDNIWVHVMPLYIAYGMTFSLMVPFIVGMTIVVRIPMKDSIAELCRRFNPNYIAYGPAYWEAFAADNENIDLTALIVPITGGDILNEDVEIKINKYLKKQGSGSCLINGYGMTEANVVVSVNYQHIHKLGSVGIPLIKNIVSAFDTETGKELKYGQKGEICIQSPSMMMKYVNNREETANVLRKHEDGQIWVHSGDLGYVTEDGFVYISGRLKRYMLRVENGLYKKIFSIDIEKVLLKNPKVEKCAVVPMKDENTFQAPAAFIIWNKECGSDKDLEEIKAYAEKNLDGGHRPIKYIVVDKFPLTRVGKVDYLTLEKIANAENEC